MRVAAFALLNFPEERPTKSQSGLSSNLSFDMFRDHKLLTWRVLSLCDNGSSD
jgi:hypothetical protein